MSVFRLISLLALTGLLATTPWRVLAMGTSFTYQGSLEDGGVPASGNYDFEFRLINTGGVVIATNLRDNVDVVDGVFTVELNFGSTTLFPGNFVRFLQIGIRPAGSTGAYEFLSPLTRINPAPYAQRAAVVTEGAIGESSIASGAVTSTRLANSAVTSGKLADGAVTAAKLADGAVTNGKLGNNSVTNAKVAAGTLTMSRLAGVYFDGSIGSLTGGGGACSSFNVPIAGALAGDFPLVALQAGQTLPAGMTLTATRVPSNGVMELRACNVSNSTSSWTGLDLKFATVR